MKILHVTKKYPEALGGDAFVVSSLETQQILAGHKVSILTSNCPEIKNDKNVYKFGLQERPVALDKITFKRLVSLMILFVTAFTVLKKKPDIIHTHAIDLAFFISFAAKWYRIPIVHTFHIITFNDQRQSIVRRKTELLLLRVIRPQKILIQNPQVINDFNKHGFHNVQFVPNGINIKEWDHINNIKKNKEVTFIAVGRLEEQKGFKYLIEAASILKKQDKEFKVEIVGEGSQYDLLATLIKHHKLESTVFLLGRRSQKELKILYEKAYAFVLSSLWESFPLSILEAWACKLPTIATKVGALDVICDNIVNAVLVNPANSSELAFAMNNLINDKNLVNLLSQNGYITVTKKYDWTPIINQIEKIYKQVLR